MFKFYIPLDNFSFFLFQLLLQEYKSLTSFGIVVGWVVLLSEKFSLQRISQNSPTFLEESLSSGCPSTNRHSGLCLEQDKVYLVFTNSNLNKYHKRSYKVTQTIQYLIVCGDLENFECRNEIECFKCKFVD